MRQESQTYNHWGASACQAAVGLGQGKWCLCKLNWQFLPDWAIFSVNPYGEWNESLLIDEPIFNEIMAKKLMDFLHCADIKEKYGIEWDISHKTTCKYLHMLSYWFQFTPKGQYVDGHERGCCGYQQKVFLPKWQKILDQLASGIRTWQNIYVPLVTDTWLSGFMINLSSMCTITIRKAGITKMWVINLTQNGKVLH